VHAEERPFPLRTGVAEVVRVAHLTPLTRRISLTAPEFEDLGIEEPGEIITLGWPARGRELVLPERGWRFPRGTRGQHWRNFTVRRHRPELAEIDVDFVLHGHGRASGWAAGAERGDSVGFAGPRVHWRNNGGADWSLLVADETGLPALLAILEALPAGHRALALAEVADERERQPVESQADIELEWLTRRGLPAGTSLLADAVRGLDLPPGRGRVWGGGEALAMRAVREELGQRVEPEAVDALGYWKRRRRLTSGGAATG
jgi:NADPH-dependent ferric siderophore reductase